MGKEKACQNVQMCQIGLPGFSSSTEGNVMNSFQFNTIFS